MTSASLLTRSSSRGIKSVVFGITPKGEVTPLNAWRARTIHDVIDDGIGGVIAAVVITFGFIVRWAVAVGLVGLIIRLLSQIPDRSLFELTVAQLLYAALLVLAMVGLIDWAFRSGKKHYVAWACLGVAAILWAIYLA